MREIIIWKAIDCSIAMVPKEEILKVLKVIQLMVPNASHNQMNGFLKVFRSSWMWNIIYRYSKNESLENHRSTVGYFSELNILVYWKSCTTEFGFQSLASYEGS